VGLILSLWNENRAKVNKWYRKPLDRCISGNGKPYSISLKKGTVNKLLVTFLGGGASWSEETARTPISMRSIITMKQGYYLEHVPPVFLKMGHVGLLASGDKRNPFHDWFILNIPYSTADFHIGCNDFNYKDDKGKERTLYHHGMKNVRSALSVLKEFFGETPETLVISGCSAGAFGCLAHVSEISDLYPDCENIIVYTEGAHLHSPLWNEIIRTVWKTESDLVTYIESDDLVFDFLRYAQDNTPSHTRFLYSVSVWDEALVQFMSKMNHGEVAVSEQTLQEFHETLIETVKKLKKNITNFSYYLTDFGKKKDGVTPHIFSGSPKLLYNKMQDDISLADWISQGLDESPPDVGVKFIN